MQEIVFPLTASL